MCKIGSPLLSFLLCSLCTPLQSWFKKFFDAFSFYIASDDEKAKADGILSMLYVVGHEGKIKYYRDDRLAMLCRMLYRQLGILL